MSPSAAPSITADSPIPALATYAAIVGDDHVLTAEAERLAYGRDRLPFGNFRYRSGAEPGTLPRFVVCPADEDEVAAVLAAANAQGQAVIPYGAGSGVLGGAVPLDNEVTIDLKRLNRMVEINEINGTATVEAGMNGGVFEQTLNRAGFTAGHYPQSINMSTVGGWAACRGAGQASSRYGKIEDMVVGLRAVLADGRRIDVRPVARRSVGPSLIDLFVGSEGTLGIITQLTLRIWRKPQVERGHVIVFPNHEMGLTALRRVMQAELRPTIVRLYDAEETQARGGAELGLAHGTAMCVMMFSGDDRLVAVEEALTLELCRAGGGVETSRAPLDRWLAERFHSYSAKVISSGAYMDTIEISGPWDRLPAMYRAMQAAATALDDSVSFGAHWSHVYPDGACMYMTLKFKAADDQAAFRIHHDLWDRISTLCIDHGGSIAHHHGAGYFRNPWLVRELGTGHGVMRAVKQALDPRGILNPGKLALGPTA